MTKTERQRIERAIRYIEAAGVLAATLQLKAARRFAKGGDECLAELRERLAAE